jgi:hypothetical protein
VRRSERPVSAGAWFTPFRGFGVHPLVSVTSGVLGGSLRAGYGLLRRVRPLRDPHALQASLRPYKYSMEGV